MLTVYSNKIKGFCGLGFVAWISFAAWDFISVSDAVLICAIAFGFLMYYRFLPSSDF